MGLFNPPSITQKKSKLFNPPGTTTKIKVVDRPIFKQDITTIQNYPNQANAFDTKLKVIGAPPKTDTIRKQTIAEQLRQTTLGKVGAAIQKTQKEVVPAFGKELLKGFDTLLRAERATTELAVAPIAYGLSKVTPGEKPSFSQLAEQQYSEAKNLIKGDRKWGQSVEEAGTQYVKNRNIKSINDVNLEDIAVLSSLAFFNLMGDPITRGGVVAKELKEAATFKKVGEIKKIFPEGTTLKNPRIVEIPLYKEGGKDIIKIKIDPSSNQLTVKGFVRRGWTPAETATNEKALVNILSQNSGVPVESVRLGVDLILRPTAITLARASQAGFARVPFAGQKSLFNPPKQQEPTKPAEKASEIINVPGIGEVPIMGDIDSATGKITYTKKETAKTPEADWEENYSDEVANLVNREQKLKTIIKDKATPKAEIKELQATLDGVIKRQADLENEWMEKWGSESAINNKKPTSKMVGENVEKNKNYSPSTFVPEKVSSAISPPGTNLPPSETSEIKPPSGVSDMRYILPSNLYKPVKFSDELFDSNSDININKLPNNLIILYEKAFVNSKLLDAKFNELKQSIPDSDYYIRVKAPERALEKFNTGSKVKDLLGSQFVVKTRGEFDDVEKWIINNFDIYSKTDYSKTPNSWGYNGRNFFIKNKDGFVYEIQIHTPESKQAASEAHPYYEKWRGKSVLTEKEKIEFLKDQKTSRAIFERYIAKETKPEVKPLEYKQAKEVRDTKLKEALEGEMGARKVAEIENIIARREKLNIDVVAGIRNNPYFRKENSIKDIMGEGWLLEKNGRFVVAEPELAKKYEKLGYNKNIEIDSLAQEAGYERGLDYLEDMLEISKLPQTTNLRNAIEKELMKQPEYKKAKEILASVSGETVKKSTYLLQKAKATTVYQRKAKVRAVRDYFNLTDKDLKNLTQRNIALMSDTEFSKFLDDLKVKAENLTERQQAKNELIAQIEEKELGNFDVLRQVMKLPKISEMNTTQLRQFFEALEPYQKGDVFLGQRKLETINRTELEGIKTWREVKERLANKLQVPVEKLSEFGKITELDRLKSPTTLAEKDPFFQMVVLESEALRLERAAEYLKIEKEVLALTKKLKLPMGEKLVGQQKNIARWFDAKDKMSVNISKEEEAVIKYVQDELGKALEYLVQMEALKKGINKDFYYPHSQKGFLETLKDEGFKRAVQQIFIKQKVGEAPFDILDRQTGEILAYDKFFPYALHRTGGIIPSENVVGSFLTYMKKFKEKQALDEMTPLIDIYSQSLTPPGLTKEGLLLHGGLVRFMKEWLNTQKGRHITLIAKQGGKIDMGIRAIKTFTYLWDLGLNIPVSLATQLGEQVVTYKILGKKNYLLAKARSLTPQGRKIVAKYRNFIGKSIWGELAEPAKDIGERLNKGIFSLFKDANVRRNKNILLGSLTKEEFQSGEVSTQRLAEIKIDSGRYAMLEGSKSIIGATPEGKVWTQYKSWALPILRSELENIINLKNVFSKDKQPAKDAFVQLWRSLEVVAFVLILRALLGDEEEDTFLGRMKTRAYKELMTVYQALNPSTFFSTPRAYTFAKDFFTNLWTLVTLEEYKASKAGEYEKGELRGDNLLINQFTPRAVKQFENKKTGTKSVDDLFKGLESGAKNKTVDDLFKGLDNTKTNSVDDLFKGL